MVVAPRDRGPSSITAAELEGQLSELKATVKIERFFWVFGISVLLYILALKLDLGMTGAAVVGFLLIVFLIGLAGHLQVPWVVKHLEFGLSVMHKLVSGKEPDTE